jgi:uncharacterized membrane protein
MPAMPRPVDRRRREENEIEFARIVAFSDGVFAIAITLLVLGLDVGKGVPTDHLWHAIGEQWDNFLAYAISFAVIGRFWIVHHRFFGEVKAFDGHLLWLNILYLAAIVLIPFSSKLLGEYGGHTPAAVVYAGNLAVVVLVGLWLTTYAHRAGLTTSDGPTKRENRIRASYIAAIFLASIPVAFLAPGVAELMWLALFFDPGSRFAGREASPSS